MKTIKKTFEPNDENPMEAYDSPLGGVIACITIAFLVAVGIVSLVALVVYGVEIGIKIIEQL